MKKLNDKTFILYKEFCKKYNLKESNFNNLKMFLEVV